MKKLIGVLVAIGASQAVAQFDIAQMPTRVRADQNCDSEVTPADISAWVANYNINDLRADQNGDGLLTPADFSAFIANFNLGLEGPFGPAYGCGSGTTLNKLVVDGILPTAWPTTINISSVISVNPPQIQPAGVIYNAYSIDAPMMGRLIIENRMYSGDNPDNNPAVGNVDKAIVEYKICAISIQRPNQNSYHAVGLVDEISAVTIEESTESIVADYGHVLDGVVILGVYDTFAEAVSAVNSLQSYYSTEVLDSNGGVIQTYDPSVDVVYDVDLDTITEVEFLQVSCAQLFPGDCLAIARCAYGRAIERCMTQYKSANASCSRSAVRNVLIGGGGACVACLLSPLTSGPCCLIAVTAVTIGTVLDAGDCTATALQDKRDCLATAKDNFDANAAGCD